MSHYYRHSVRYEGPDQIEIQISPLTPDYYSPPAFLSDADRATVSAAFAAAHDLSITSGLTAWTETGYPTADAVIRSWGRAGEAGRLDTLAQCREVWDDVFRDARAALIRSLAPVVVTRHTALVEYLRETGVVGADVVVLAHVEAPEQIRGRRVIGVLPMHLAVHADRITEVPMMLTPADREAMQRGDLSLERVRQVAGAPQTYRVARA